MIRLIPLAFLLAVSLGCGGGKPSGSGPAKGGDKKDDHDHSDHDRDGMMLEDFGPHHAGLTAHITKEGSELDIVIETTAKDPKPVPLPLTKITAKAKRAGDPKEYDLEFLPDDPAERKGDPAGQCSRFSAKAPWMKADDVLTVTATIDFAGKPRKVEWKDFNPKKYSHSHDEKDEKKK
jgi:hypothetical protein